MDSPPRTPSRPSSPSPASPVPPTGPSVASRTLTGTVALLVLQIGSRILTWGLQQVLLRYTGPEVLGIVSVRLELLLAVVCFLATEGVKIAGLRGTGADEEVTSHTHENGTGNGLASGNGLANANGVSAHPAPTPLATHKRAPSLSKRKRPSNSYQSQPPGAVRNDHHVVSYADSQRRLANLSYLTLPLSVLVAIPAAFIFITNPPESAPASYTTACILYASSALLETASSPLYIPCASRLEISVRATIEGSAVLTRSVSVAAFFYMAWKAGNGAVDPSDALVAFALGQLVYAVTIWAGYVRFWRARIVRARNAVKVGLGSEDDKFLASVGAGMFFPSLVEDGNGGKEFLPKETYYLAATSTAQSMVKFLLNQGDKLLLNVLATAREQGVYAFAFNTGEIAIDSLRSFYSVSLHSPTITRPPLSGLRATLPVLSSVAHLATLISLPFLFILPFFTSTFISLLAGPAWLEASPVLSLYCLFLPLLILTGIGDAFVQASASPTQLSAYTAWLVAFWGVFAGAARLMVTELGVIGVVLACMVNAVLRITYSAWYARSYYLGASWATDGDEDEEDRKWRLEDAGRYFRISALAPTHPAVIVTWGAAAVACRASEVHLLQLDSYPLRLAHVGVGCGAALLATVVTAWTEREFLRGAIAAVGEIGKQGGSGGGVKSRAHKIKADGSAYEIFGVGGNLASTPVEEDERPLLNSMGSPMSQSSQSGSDYE